MGREIERKFLVIDDSWRALARQSLFIRQGYLATGAAASVRIRIVAEQGGWITIKSTEPGIARAEFEYQIPLEDAEALFALCAEGTIEKRRHLVQRDELAWEIDVFEGPHQGLVMAEIELPESDHPVAPPPWLGREVTDDPAYRNASLARAGIVPNGR